MAVIPGVGTIFGEGKGAFARLPEAFNPRSSLGFPNLRELLEGLGISDAAKNAGVWARSPDDPSSLEAVLRGGESPTREGPPRFASTRYEQGTPPSEIRVSEPAQARAPRTPEARAEQPLPSGETPAPQQPAAAAPPAPLPAAGAAVDPAELFTGAPDEGTGNSSFMQRRPMPEEDDGRPGEQRLFVNGGSLTQGEMIALGQRGGAIAGAGLSGDDDAERRRREEEDRDVGEAIGKILARDYYAQASSYSAEVVAALGAELRSAVAQNAELAREIEKLQESMGILRDRTIPGLEQQQAQGQGNLSAAGQTLDRAREQAVQAETVAGAARKEAGYNATATGVIEGNSIFTLEGGRMIFSKQDESGKITFVDQNGERFTDPRDLAEIDRRIAEATRVANAGGMRLADASEPVLPSSYEDYLWQKEEAAAAGKDLQVASENLDTAKTRLDLAQSAYDQADATLKETGEQLEQARLDLRTMSSKSESMRTEYLAREQEIAGLEERQRLATEFQRKLPEMEQRGASAGEIYKEMPEFMRDDFLKRNPEFAAALEQEKAAPGPGPRTGISAAAAMDGNNGSQSPAFNAASGAGPAPQVPGLIPGLPGPGIDLAGMARQLTAALSPSR